MRGEPDDLIEYFEERAAVLEFEQGLPRDEAEKEAWRRTREQFGQAPVGKPPVIPGERRYNERRPFPPEAPCERQTTGYTPCCSCGATTSGGP